ncbi:MAG: HNH endonuclease [Chloroflexi bacterium]|nr:HNH endonuclease [Chloroflexota bacterium]
MTSSYISEELRQRVRVTAGDRCGYCRSHQQYLLTPLEIEHIIPSSREGTNDEENLWVACARCNRFKSSQIEAVDPVTKEVHPLFNPRTQKWSSHFQWDADGVVILGLTPIGRASVEALHLNHELSIAVRRNWVAAGWHPPSE